MVPAVSPVKDSSSCTGRASHNLLLHLCNSYAGYVPFDSGCSPASPFQNILCFQFYANFKTVAKIIFFIQPTFRCIGGLLRKLSKAASHSSCSNGIFIKVLLNDNIFYFN